MTKYYWFLADVSILYISLLDPLLIYEKAEMGEDGFEGALDLFPETFDPKRIQPEFSGVCMCVRERIKVHLYVARVKSIMW